MPDECTVGKINKTECIGCKLCAEVCCSHAITFSADREGFWYPQIEYEKCIKCGRCVESCPTTKLRDTKELPLQTYASWNKDNDERRNATSGGIFSVLGDYVLKKNGFLIGSRYEDDYKGACHTVVEDRDGFQRLKGSKYFQSATAGIFNKTKECLNTGREVLFVGTPCQVAALYAYLGVRPANLVTLDFICRGVSSPLLQKLKIEYYEKKARSKVVFYRDKYKKYAWIDFGALIRFENGKERFISRWRDEILHFFIMKNLNIRPSCYECRFKLGHMQSDITMGDFWHIDHVTEKDLRDGVSALMVNTEKGRAVLENVRESLYLCKKPLERVISGNPAYSDPPDRPVEREEFFETVQTGGWESALRKYKTFRAENEKQKKYHEKRMKKRPYLQLIDDWKEICWRDFVHYNFFCKEVIRDKNAYIVPYKGAVIDIQDGAKLYIKGNASINYSPFYPRGNKQAVFQLRKGAQVHLNNRLELGYGAMVSVGENAYFESGYFMPRMGSNIICKSKMVMGENVGVGRDSCLMDSDYHPIYDEKFDQINEDREIEVGDNVWLGMHCLVLKGARIRDGSVVGSGSIVSGEVPEGKLFLNKRKNNADRDVYHWEW